MIKIGPKYMKLKTDLQLACKRLKILQAKKMELSQKLQKEIANHLNKSRFMPAKIKVQTVIRYEAAQEAMEIIEMLCEQILDRYSLFEEMKELDQSLEETVSSLIWVSPYLRSEIFELKDIFKQLTVKYGSDYSKSALKNKQLTVNSELIERIKLTIPSEDKIHEYLREIAEKHSVPEDRKIEMEAYFLKKDSLECKRTGQNIDTVGSRRSPSSPKGSVNLDDEDTETFEGYGTSIQDTPVSCKKVFSNLKFEKNRRPKVGWTRKFFHHNVLPTVPEENENLETDYLFQDRDHGLIHNTNGCNDDRDNKGDTTNSSLVSKRNHISSSVNDNSNKIEGYRNKEVPTATEIRSNFLLSTHKKRGNFRVKIPTTYESDRKFGSLDDETTNTSKIDVGSNLISGKDVMNDFEDNSSTYTEFDEPPSYETVVCNIADDKLDVAHPYQFEVDIKLECFPQYPTLPTCPTLEEMSEKRFENKRYPQIRKDAGKDFKTFSNEKKASI